MGNTYYSTQLKRLKANLLQVGKKVLQSKLRLSEELRKLLHQKSLQENKQVTSEINEIKKCFIENKELFLNLNDKEFLCIDFLPEVFLPMERPLWTSMADLTFDQKKINYGENDIGEKAMQLEELRKSFYLNPEELKIRILDLMKDREDISLKEVLNKYPIEKGTSELIGYLDIAEANQANSINEEQTDHFLFKTSGGEGKLAVPHVVFLKLGI
jgi:hypothetical protein